MGGCGIAKRHKHNRQAMKTIRGYPQYSGEVAVKRTGVPVEETGIDETEQGQEWGGEARS